MCVMNIITWNVTGLGRPAKRFLVKDFLNLHFADVCYLQESKLEEISPALWRKIGGSRLDHSSLCQRMAQRMGLSWFGIVGF